MYPETKQPLSLNDLTPVQLEFIRTCREYAFKCHADTNHLYDGKSYSTHLLMVFNYGLKYSYLYAGQKDSIHYALASCYTHDTIEDARQTYNDVKLVCGELVADITYALTNDKGKTRKERAGKKYYSGITVIPYAAYVKICDRLANVKYSKDQKSSMLDKYRKENAEFKSYLFNERFVDMFNELDELLKEE